MEYIFGKNTIDSFIESKNIIEVFIASNFSDEKLLKKIRKANIKVSVKDKVFLDKVSSSGKHQGIVASIKSFSYAKIEEIIDIGSVYRCRHCGDCCAQRRCNGTDTEAFLICRYDRRGSVLDLRGV